MGLGLPRPCRLSGIWKGYQLYKKIFAVMESKVFLTSFSSTNEALWIFTTGPDVFLSSRQKLDVTHELESDGPTAFFKIGGLRASCESPRGASRRKTYLVVVRSVISLASSSSSFFGSLEIRGT